jgi:dolichyl-phosphate-mannose-protein mannosyltransferase
MFSTLFKHPRLYVILLGLILAFALVTRLYKLERPDHYIFDEVYHAVTAKLIKQNDPRAYEWWNPAPEPNTAVDWLHPPLAKYTQAVSMMVFGENSFGWRFSSAIFGVLVIAATAKLAYELFGDQKIALLAAFLASLDGLLLVQSRIAMNDIHVTFFILLTLVSYVKYRKSLPLKGEASNALRSVFLLFLTGLSCGLAMASKWSGVFTVGIILGWELWSSLLPHVPAAIPTKKSKKHVTVTAAPQFSLSKRQTPPRIVKFLFLIIMPIALYILSYSHMFLQGKSLICEGQQVAQGQCYCSQDSSWWVVALSKLSPSQKSFWESLEARGGCKRLISHFSELHHQIWWYQTNLKATHPFQSRPLEWFTDIRPVWMHVEYGTDTIANIYAQGNPALFWIGDVAVVATFFVIFLWIGTQLSSFIHTRTIQWQEIMRPEYGAVLFTLFSYLAVWVLWEFSPRIMFFYHYTPAVPLLCILLSFWLIRLRQYKEVVITAVLLIVLCFIIWYPNWTGIPVPKEFANAVYFFLPTWR